MVAEFVLQIMNYISDYVQSKTGKMDTASEYKYFERVVHINIFAICMTLLIGTFCFMGLEGWSFAKALYFAVETSTVSFINVVVLTCDLFLLFRLWDMVIFLSAIQIQHILS
jgi:hypothetical protein